MSVAAEPQPITAEPSRLCHVSEVAAGSVIRLVEDDAYGVVLAASGESGCIGVDFWHQTAALVALDELVEVVDDPRSRQR